MPTRAEWCLGSLAVETFPVYFMGHFGNLIRTALHRWDLAHILNIARGGGHSSLIPLLNRTLPDYTFHVPV